MTTLVSNEIRRIYKADQTCEIYRICGQIETVAATVTYNLGHGDNKTYTGNIYRYENTVVVSDDHGHDYILCDMANIVEIRKAVAS
jgi:hypothetical protein